MAGVNKAIILGNLGNDPEVHEMQNGRKVCRLSVATTRRWKDKNTNETVEETEWHRISVWGPQADPCMKYLKKGRQVYVEGRLRTSSYEKDGVTKYSTEIVADSVQFIGSKDDAGGGGNNSNSNSSGGASAARANEPTPPIDDDDIPF